MSSVADDYVQLVTSYDALIEYYQWYGDSTFSEDEPAYAAVCHRLGEFPDLVALIAAHEREAQQPNLLFAAAHFLLLGGLEHRLGDIYAGRSTADPVEAFADLVLSHADQVNELLATRRTQTNEVARSAVIAPLLRDAYERAGQPLAWVDLGASGGLNLNVDRFRIDYAIGDEVKSTGPDSTLELDCAVRSGRPLIHPEHAPIQWRIGVDRSPIDVTDPDQARWLQACLWPSKVERHTRLATAIEIATEHPQTVIGADAVEGIHQAIAQAPPTAALVVTTTWVWFYLPDSTKRSVLECMRQAGRPVAWYSLEGRGVVAELSEPSGLEVTDSLIGRVEFDGGEVTNADVLGMCHPHGAWLDWH